MGIGFVFVIYVILLVVLAVPAMAFCAGMGWFLTRKRSRQLRRIFMFWGAALPIIGAVYLVISIVVMALVGLATGHDVGFGDGFDIPLHNGYRWSAIDEPVGAWIYSSDDREATSDGGIHVEPSDRNAFQDVLDLQEDGDWLAGDYDSDIMKMNRDAMKADRWFLFNTRTRERIDVESKEELRKAAAAHGFSLRLQSSEDFYRSHMFTLRFGLAVLVLLLPPLAGIYWLWGNARGLLKRDFATNSG